MGKEVILQFLNYRVEKMSYSINPFYNEGEKSNIFPKLAFHIIQSPDDENMFNVIIGAKYDKNHNFPFISEAVIRGFFRTSEGLENKEKTMIVNASAIMYPYLRALISDITSKSEICPIILPTMNFIKSFPENKDDFILDSKYFVKYEE